ncbi:MAG: winged helix-turn-helix domain-containing protein [Micrococcaceae bacterium]|nr:winged helix-turn-helix domain-containing protein [Micrococcaceae bacterium]
MTVRTLSLAQARRVAIAAQGLDRQRPDIVSLRHITDTIKRIGLLQIDSVNIVARAHLLPLLARLGPYDIGLVGRASARAPRRILETWAHEASYVPATTFPLLTWNRRRWPGMDPEALAAEHPELFRLVRDIVADHGPLTSREIEAFADAAHAKRPHGQWGWEWSPVKTALEILFDAGELTPARRNAQFERVYDLTSRALPPDIPSQIPPAKDEAIIELVRIASRAHGIGTVRCFADYFRLNQRETRRAVDALQAHGELLPVTVTGWNRPLWMHSQTRVPRRTNARALLVPFDPLVFERRRLLELFGMHYRLEIYTPAHKRTYGYYVLPFLLGEHLVARVDLKYDRKHGVLVVRAAYAEPPGPDDAARATWPDRTTRGKELIAELTTMASWLGAGDVVVEDAAPGDLSADLHELLSYNTLIT